MQAAGAADAANRFVRQLCAGAAQAAETGACASGLRNWRPEFTESKTSQSRVVVDATLGVAWWLSWRLCNIYERTWPSERPFAGIDEVCDDVWLHVFELLDDREDLRALAVVCRKFRRIASDATLRQRFSLRKVPTNVLRFVHLEVPISAIVVGNRKVRRAAPRRAAPRARSHSRSGVDGARVARRHAMSVRARSRGVCCLLRFCWPSISRAASRCSTTRRSTMLRADCAHRDRLSASIR